MLEKNFPQDFLYPTRFAGYYVTKCGRVFRDPHKFFDGKNLSEKVEVGAHVRGGAGANKRHYKSVNVSLKENGRTVKQIRVYVHRLVAETLVDNPHNYSEVDHIDRDKLNNRVDNLRWCNHPTNCRNR